MVEEKVSRRTGCKKNRTMYRPLSTNIRAWLTVFTLDDFRIRFSFIIDETFFTSYTAWRNGEPARMSTADWVVVLTGHEHNYCRLGLNSTRVQWFAGSTKHECSVALVSSWTQLQESAVEHCVDWTREHGCTCLQIEFTPQSSIALGNRPPAGSAGLSWANCPAVELNCPGVHTCTGSTEDGCKTVLACSWSPPFSHLEPSWSNAGLPPSAGEPNFQSPSTHTTQCTVVLMQLSPNPVVRTRPIWWSMVGKILGPLSVYSRTKYTFTVCRTEPHPQSNLPYNNLTLVYNYLYIATGLSKQL